ncbi:XRE family transcriptional regulator [Zavarzinia aquatilis]|uniref:HTH cro/C1-type domain-containing protein n=1 Tax=Zavarzinia aquatilis TaxID=2211142 RepID=A0A317EHX9_9PROT|nr:LexA family transcriptional regulator [Zavarzinia aquatilis]PWR25670.1 hypothetical protein DKG74_01525 [Zavarzinia aquatilis]
MTSVGARLSRFRQKLGLSQEELAVQLGVAERTYQAYERNETEPRCHVLKALADVGGDPTWLVTGRTPAVGRDRAEATGSPMFLAIPHFAETLRLPGEQDVDGETSHAALSLTHDWAAGLTGCNPADLVHAFAGDDAMAPVIAVGDLLLIDNSDCDLRHGRLYAFLSSDILLIRRIGRTVAGQLLLVTEDVRYPAEPLPIANGEASFSVIGRVRWHGRRLPD